MSTGQAIDPPQGIDATTFDDQIKAFFADCAQVLRGQGDSKGAERFDQASTHRMRHSHASHALAGGVPIEIAQQNLGYASLATTTDCVTAGRWLRIQAVEAFWKRQGRVAELRTCCGAVSRLHAARSLVSAGVLSRRHSNSTGRIAGVLSALGSP